MDTPHGSARAADHLPVRPRKHNAASGHEGHATADLDTPSPALKTQTNGVDMSREVSEDENSLDFEAAIWFG